MPGAPGQLLEQRLARARLQDALRLQRRQQRRNAVRIGRLCVPDPLRKPVRVPKDVSMHGLLTGGNAGDSGGHPALCQVLTERLLQVVIQSRC